MKKISLFVLMFFIVFTVSAKVSIFLKLDKVVKEPKLKIEMKSEDGQSFSDDLINTLWETAPWGFSFELTNKSSSPLTIIWEDCSFTNEDRVISNVLHSQKDKILKIEAGAKISDIVAPSDYMIWGGENWAMNSIFIAKMSDDEFEEIAKKDLVYKVTLALKKDRIKSIYHFYFKAYAK